MATSTASVPPPPPRWAGNSEQDFPAMVEYLSAFYRAAVTQGYFASQSSLDTVVSNQVDPAQATAASAQSTANSALSLANTVNTRTLYDSSGAVTIANAATTAAVTISTQPDTNYFPVFSGAGFTGAPSASAFVAVSITAKTTTGFTVTIAVAPGVGNSVTLNWRVAR